MRQNKQTVSLFGLRRWLLLAFALVGLCLAAVPSEHTSAQQPANTNAAQKSRTKRITPLRTSETADGSRVTITSDGELNDYSAYRSGDRFIVVVPQAEGGGGGARGKGFEGAQVEKRGKDLVYTFKLQPGATARVNQRFNRLDVQFSAPRTAGQTTATTRPTPTPAPTPKRTLPEEAGITKPQTNANNAQPTPDARRTPDANANNNIAATTATPFVIPTPGVTTTPAGVVPSPTLAPTAATTTPGADTIAQTQPTAAAPVSITTGTQPATSPTSVGAVVTRNWPWLLAALLAVGIGLFVVSRFRGDRDQSKPLPPAAPSGTKPVTTTVKETKTAELKPSSVSTASTTTTTTGTTAGATTGATAAASSAATAASLVSSGKQSKKKKKKAEKAKRLAAENELKSGGTTTAAGTSVSGAGATAKDAGATAKDSGTGGALAAGALIAGAGAAIIGGASEVEESKAAGTKAVEAKASETKAVEPSVAFEPERIEAEIKKLLTGESYDESVINASDAGTRQLVSAELMSAIAGRNASRRAHACTAFLKHGYFDEAARALQSAEAPGERAAAAHTLGLYGDRTATPHLTAALEDPAPDVRRTAVEALAEMRDPSAIGALEALRWREVSRQVPRTLIQRAIEATRLAESEEAAAAATVTPEVADDDTPTLATPSGAAVMPAETEASAVETEEDETKEIEAKADETKEIEVAVATVAVAEPATVGAVESDTTQESPVLAATVVEATPEETPVALDESPDIETKAAVDEAEVAAVETKALEIAAPPADSAQEVKAGVETPPVPVEIDLASTLAAKEASLIKAREREDSTAESDKATDDIAPVVATDTLTATPELTTVTHSPESQTATPASFVDAVREETTANAGSSPVYHSDFAVGSGKQAGAGDGEWVALDADEHEVTVQSVDAAPPAEPLGTFYAEDSTGWALETDAKETHAPEASRPDDSASLFDALEVEAFETNAADPAPIVSTPTPAPVEPARAEDATTQTLNFKYDAPAASDLIGGTEIVKADKGLTLVDGSDEEEFSIIPKGIQLRLTSDEPSERAASVLALSRLNTDEAFNEICAAFDDPAEEVRNAAARALYDIHEDRADSFTRALRESPVERRRQIGAALAGSGLADEAVGNLTGESRDKTYDAFSLLFLMAKAGEVAPLIRAIESHPDNEVRLAVVKLLALSGQQEILPAFRRLAVRGSLPTEVRSAVMEAIYQISSQPQNATPAT